ncbi:MAG: flagellar hook-length control protein FliK [Comamonadaceae bacterium]
MLSALLLKGVEPVATIRGMGSGRSGPAGTPSPFDPGEIFKAQVEARLPDGNFRVLAAGQSLSLALPSSFAPGDKVELEFITSEPQLTFALRGSTQPASDSSLSLSLTGRLLASTMLQPGEVPKPVSAAVAGPLQTGPSNDAAPLSRALSQTFSGSGLFYESHQAEWVAGTRSLAQILQEPQGQLPTSGPRDERMIQTQAVPLVQQQLAALDTSAVLMHIEIWPRQWMQWTVEEHHTSAPPEEQQEAQSAWSTSLHLELPQLGELNASLGFGMDGVRIRIHASSADSATLLQEHRAALLEALAAADLPTASIVIAHHGQA